VLDGIQDPGNAGTLVRTAAAFALDAVLALDGTVDPWNPKAVRASAGACFRIACASERWERLRPALLDAGLPLLVADAGGEEVGRRAGLPAWALVIGSEGGGARPEVRAAASTSVGVAMPGGTESLNAGVAGAILMFALTSRIDPRATARRGDSGA
jgi:TrmH family RNA methyltransferase